MVRTDQERGESEGFGSIEEETRGDGLTEEEEGRKEGAANGHSNMFFITQVFFLLKKN